MYLGTGRTRQETRLKNSDYRVDKMKTTKKSLAGVWLVLGLLSLFVWGARAQETSGNGSCCTRGAVQASHAVCPDSGGCPVSGVRPAVISGASAGQTQCPFINAQISPALPIESQGKRGCLRCPRREGVFEKASRKSPSVRPQFSI